MTLKKSYIYLEYKIFSCLDCLDILLFVIVFYL